MLLHPTTSAAQKKAVTPRHALLENLIAIVKRHVSDQFLDFTLRIAGALVDAADMDGDVRAIQARIRAGNLLRNNHFGFLNLVIKELERALRQEIAELAPGQKARARAPDEPMSLVPFAEMDSKVTLGGLSKPFEVQYSDALATLNVRLAFLLDRDILRVNQNPFRPDVLLNALQQAWLAFNPDEEAASLLLGLLRPGMFMELSSMFQELNLTLQRQGVLPGSVDGARARKAESHDASSANPARKRKQQAELAQQLRQFFTAAQDPALDPDLVIPDLPDIANLKAGAWAQAGGQGFHPGVTNETTRRAVQANVKQPLLSYLAEVQQHAMPAQGIMMAGGQGAAAMATPGGFVVSGHSAGMQPGAGFVPAGYLPAGAAMTVATATAVPGAGFAAAGGGYAVPVGGFMPAESAAAASGGLLGMLAAGVAGLGEAGEPGASAAAGSGSGPATPSANVFYLPNIKKNAPKGSLTRADESTIDLLSAIFDTVFRDPNISQEIRDLIRFLQIPVLKAALLDKDFFFQDAHPARRLIDLLSRMGWEQRKSPDDPLFQAMQRSVERVGRDHDHELSVFTEAVNELEASIKAEESAAAAAIAEPIAAALKQEKMAEAAKSAKSAVALRIGTGEVVAIVEAFLENKWVSVLTIAYSVEADKPGAVKNATQTMDDLIWSVKPKITADERKQLIGKLPKLLSTLNKWLDVIKWQDADRLQFFAELAECHASIVRAPLEISPERQLEIAMEAAQKAAERRLELERKAAAEAAAANTPAPPQDDDSTIEADGLTRGMWLEFDQDDGSTRKVKLAWISPLRTLYIFATSARQEAFSLSGEALAQRFRDQQVRVFRADGLVSRALSQAMGQMAVNDGSLDPPAGVAA
jgi:hypothetical protein